MTEATQGLSFAMILENLPDKFRLNTTSAAVTVIVSTYTGITGPPKASFPCKTSPSSNTYHELSFFLTMCFCPICVHSCVQL